MSRFRLHLLPLALLFLSIVIPYHRVLLGTEHLSGGDLLDQTYVWKQFQVDSLREGDFPLWYPRAFCGTPFLANVQTGSCYPPEYLVLWADVFHAIGLLTAGHLFLLGLAVYGVAWRTLGGRWPALVAAVMFVHAGTTVLDSGSGLVRNLFPLAWVLVALWALLDWLDTRGPLSWAALAFSVGMAWLSGSPQFIVYGFYLLGFTVLWEVLAPSRGYGPGRVTCRFRARTVGLFLAAFLLGTALAAVQIFPLVELIGLSAGRGGGGGYLFATTDSYPPGMLPTVLYPFLFGDFMSRARPYWGTRTTYIEFGAYIGALGLVLAVIGIVFGRLRRNRFWAAVAIVALILALGRFTPLYRIFFHVLPGFARMRVPARALFMVTLALSLFAGAGFQFALLEPGEGAVRRAFRVAVIFFAVCVGLLAFVTVGRDWIEDRIQNLQEARVRAELGEGASDQAVAESSPRALAAARSSGLVSEMFRPILWGGAFLVLLLLRRRYPRMVWVPWAVGLLLYADLVAFGQRFIETSPADGFRERVYPLDPVLDRLAGERTGPVPPRFVELDDLIGWYARSRIPGYHPNRPQIHGLESARGYDPLILSSYSRFFFEMQGDNPARNPMGTLFLPSLRPEYNKSFARLACPFVLTLRKIPGMRLIAADRALLYEFDGALPRAFVQPGDGAPSDPVPAVITDYSPDRVVIEGDTEKGGKLVLVETWYPGWVAGVNGEDRTVEKWEAFRAVPVPPGEFRVTFRFAPKSVMRGLVCSAAAFVVLLLVLPVGARLGRRGELSNPPRDPVN